jgi:hypothetical protein
MDCFDRSAEDGERGASGETAKERFTRTAEHIRRHLAEPRSVTVRRDRPPPHRTGGSSRIEEFATPLIPKGRRVPRPPRRPGAERRKRDAAGAAAGSRAPRRETLPGPDHAADHKPLSGTGVGHVREKDAGCKELRLRYQRTAIDLTDASRGEPKNE